MNELHLFAGAGGGILGGMLLGHTCVCAVELEPYCRRVLFQRQRDGILPPFPIWDDVRTFDGRPWRGLVDVVCGGFPCQDISVAKQGAKGIHGSRSGLFSEMARVIGEIQPKFVFVENSPALLTRGIGDVLGKLAAMGYNARWGILGASQAGAPHERKRLWIHASYSDQIRLQWGWKKSPETDFEWKRGQFERLVEHSLSVSLPAGNSGRVADGVANRVDRLAAIGNGQVPAVAALAWKVLSV